MNTYKCNKCGKVVERESKKKWIHSICGDLGVKTRIYLIKDI